MKIVNVMEEQPVLSVNFFPDQSTKNVVPVINCQSQGNPPPFPYLPDPDVKFCQASIPSNPQHAVFPKYSNTRDGFLKRRAVSKFQGKIFSE